MMRTLKYWQAVNEALGEAMAEDPSVLVVGIDAGTAGGAFGATRGLLERFGPERVRDSPISEQAIMGLAVGAALAGLRPIVEIMFCDFLTLASDQLVNHAAKARYMYGGSVTVPLVVRTAQSAHLASGAQHSSSYEAWLCHVPGLKVVMPSSPADGKALLKAAVRDDNPVVVIEPLGLWTRRGEVPDTSSLDQERLGHAEVRRAGSDATIVAMGATVERALLASEQLEERGISAAVIDLRTLSPLDWDTLLPCIAATQKLVIVHDAVGPFGVGAEIIARAAEEGALHGSSPPSRVTSAFCPVPFSAPLEDAYYPSVVDIVNAVERDGSSRYVC